MLTALHRAPQSDEGPAALMSRPASVATVRDGEPVEVQVEHFTGLHLERPNASRSRTSRRCGDPDVVNTPTVETPVGLLRSEMDQRVGQVRARGESPGIQRFPNLVGRGFALRAHLPARAILGEQFRPE